ncbi:MAG: (Fe-S)-binding protein [Candidatus Hydrothermarchaeota archaeon]
MIDYRDRIIKCALCGECNTQCIVLREIGWLSSGPKGKILMSGLALEGKLEKDLDNLYLCTTCAKCEPVCNVGLEIVDIIEHARRKLVEAGITKLPHEKMANNIFNYGNPYGEKEKIRLDSKLVEKESAEYVFFPGCTAKYRVNEIMLSSIDIFNKIGLDYVVFDENYCCGSPLFRTGFAGGFEERAGLLVEKLNKKGDKVITACPGCYRTMKNDYSKKYDLELDIQHISVFLNEKLDGIDLSLEKNMTATYHDPCHLGRHMNVYEEPRSLLKKVKNLELVEMTNNRENALCCGSGGGVRAAFDELAYQIGKKRLEEAKETNAESIISSCPFCKLMFDTLKENGLNAYDVTEVIAKSMR